MNDRNAACLTFVSLSFLVSIASCSSTGDLVFTSHDSTSSTGDAGNGHGGAGTGGSTNVGGNAGAGGNAGTGGAPITYPQDCSDVYDENILPAFDLTFTPDQLNALQIDCGNNVQQYRPVKLTYGNEVVDAMVRLKGNWTWDCSKMQFVVSFNEIDPKGRFHGLRKLVFDAPWYDRTVLHERLAMPFFKARGLPYSCVNNAMVSINGVYYGIYANLERIDKEYLQRQFDLADGNLYQAGTELKTNETIGDTSDVMALNATTTVDELAKVMDLNEAVSEWAAEAMLPAMDNYWAGVEINYYIYHHPTRGFVYLPYDMDIVFGDSAYPDGSLLWPDSLTSDPITYEHPGWLKEDRVKMVLSDPVWCQRFVDELALARAAYVPAEFAARVDTWNAQILQAVAMDPNKQFSVTDHNAAVASLKSFVQQRGAFVDQWLAQGNHCPAKF
jgi:hypothetical protein